MTAIEQILFDFKAYFNDNPWFGDSYTNVISDLTSEEALVTPPNQHSICVLLWHMVKWRKALTIRLLGNLEFKASDSDPDNWLDAASQNVSTWEAAKSAFAEQQEILVRELSKRDETFLDSEFLPGKAFRQMVSGVLQHDIYHLGQIAMLKKLIRKDRVWA